jgi:hypothetical protein
MNKFSTKQKVLNAKSGMSIPSGYYGHSSKMKLNPLNFMENCSRFNFCSTPICPLGSGAKSITRYSEDDICVYCRQRKQKGIRLSMPIELRKLVPESNVLLLSYKNR